jgi:protein O-mannosyl-transferase
VRPFFLGKPQMHNRIAATSLFALPLLLLLTWLAYAPGLHGSFLFDDFANLPAIGATGPIDNWPTFWRYITSGTADPTGRPLTLLTFLIDARNWPADPLPFKRTNLLLHLFNGVLLALLLRKLGQRFNHKDARRIDFAAVLGAGMWLLHPLFVSTTLYIVQREAMLPATFTLAGLLLWLHGRNLLHRGYICSGSLWIAIGLGGCTLLGTLSKANGVLLPALALVVEYIFLRPDSPTVTRGSQSVYRWVMRIFAWLPTTLVAGYLLEQGWSGITRGISSVRPWTLSQRLLTEPRVLMDYLELLWQPRPFTPGLLNDQVQASTSLWAPATTLPALLAVLALIIGAWLLRRRWPALALAVLFYFVGQSLESSTVALELYFEHRNYLPAMLMFWPLALWLCGARLPTNTSTAATEAVPTGQPPDVADKAKLALAAVLLLGLGLMTHARASLWGNTHDQALMWAMLNPASARAQANAAATEMSAGSPALAVARLRPALEKAPDQVQLALNLFAAECQLGHIDATTMAASRTALRTARDPGALLVSWFVRVMGQMARPPCPQLTSQTITGLLDAAASNQFLTTNPGRRQDIHYLQGRLALMQGNADIALSAFNQALEQQVRVSVALEQAALLGASGHPEQGLAHLDYYEAVGQHTDIPSFGMPRVHAWVLERQQYWPKELARLRATLRDDAARKIPSAQ